MNEPETESQRVAGTSSPAEADSSARGSLTETAESSEPWPPADAFCLPELRTLKKVQMRNGHWLGVYQGIPLGGSQGTGSQELLCASRSPSVLYSKLKKMAPTLPIIVRRASSKGGLLKQIEPAKPDRFAQLRRSAFEAVGEARQILDPDGFLLPFVPLKGYDWFVYELMDFHQLIGQPEAKSLSEALGELSGMLLRVEDRVRDLKLRQPSYYSDLSTEFNAALGAARAGKKLHVASAKAQRRIEEFLTNSGERVTNRFEKMRQAADFLHTIARMARSRGAKTGDRPTGGEIRKAVSALNRLALGEPLKAITQVANDGQVDDAKSLKAYKSVERLVSRFSKRVARAILGEYGPRIMSLDYNHLSYALRDWPWLDRRRDKLALMEAARRGLPNLFLG